MIQQINGLITNPCGKSDKKATLQNLQDTFLSKISETAGALLGLEKGKAISLPKLKSEIDSNIQCEDEYLKTKKTVDGITLTGMEWLLATGILLNSEEGLTVGQIDNFTELEIAEDMHSLIQPKILEQMVSKSAQSDLNGTNISFTGGIDDLKNSLKVLQSSDIFQSFKLEQMPQLSQMGNLFDGATLNCVSNVDVNAVKDSVLPHIIIQGSEKAESETKSDTTFNNSGNISSTSPEQSVKRTKGFSTIPINQSISTNENLSELKERMSVSVADNVYNEMHTEKENNTELHAIPITEFLDTGQVVVPVTDVASHIDKPVLNQVTDQIFVEYSENNPEFQMELYPENLGKVSVKLSVENSMLTVAIVADNPKTQSLLMSHAGRIQSILQETMGQPVQILQPMQDQPWYQQMPDQSGAKHQQEQQQRDRKKRSCYKMTPIELETSSFLSVMQQINMQD